MALFRRITAPSIDFLSKLMIMAALMSSASITQAQEQRLMLNTGWQFRIAEQHAQDHQELQSWRSAQVPGHVHTDLLHHKLIQDPYAGQAEAGLQWIGKADWEYQLQFELDAARLQHRKKILRFDGLDTFAEVFLNGEKIIAAENAFRTYEIDVSAKLKAKSNTILVRLYSPITKMLPQVQAMPHKLAGNYPSPYGDEPKDAMTANFVRKPGYHYGWDWGPRYVTAGIWRPVSLITYDEVRVEQVQVRQVKLDQQQAQLRVDLQVDVQMDLQAGLQPVSRTNPFEVWWKVRDPRGRVVAQDKRILSDLDSAIANAKEARHAQFDIKIAKPQLWYPHGYGKQALYRMEFELRAGQRVLAKQARTIGLRTVTLDRSLDQEVNPNTGKRGQAFTFLVNGIPVFAKGANLIPFDMFPNRISVAQQREILQAARDANMNMLRIWGGGYYENDDFYRMADEMGIMIWQDFMFGGGVVPAYDDAFRRNVLEEAKQQVQRLNAHPSVVLWCGNNEEETAWKDWGIGKELQKANPTFAEQVWQGYVQLFGRDLRQVVQDHGQGVPYWSSSPSNDLDDKANDSERGDKHYWDVWGGSKPVEEYQRETPRFMSEFGLQAWPQQSTVDYFAQADQQAIDHPVIRQHQKFMAGEGNARLLHYIRANYGEPRDFAHFLYLSQVMQAEGITLAIKHHRASMPRTMGSMYWQLNDVWPGASWSSIDYFGNWKALHYQARKAFAPLTVVAENLDGVTSVSVASERLQNTVVKVRLRSMDFTGKVFREQIIPFNIGPNTAQRIAHIRNEELLQGRDPRSHFVLMELLQGEAVIAQDEIYFAPAKELKLPSANIELTWKSVGNRYQLQLKSPVLARAVILDFRGAPVKLSDNALTLQPQRTLKIEVSSRESMQKLAQLLQVRSLNDK
ncbi:glycoside hydrolase family 2 protein [Undibacterium cyanobacteriorum]|uniref:Beta-mannosidase B n=1 Tax=Undibacterium cyanobacteriorum TaxID=3073561 RepID=A0ABY9RH92_9BURK|nr:glycoside hydrolase family 2 protein [Undibacterium sp. 20NA77.5]WMW80034.1 glycoside hydrolase family 2 protein [Undibacterium sp. 20NA77.5]